MTKSECKKAIQRGLGRGYFAVYEDPERHREAVLWACGRNLAFDTQCEGTRAWYVYQLISCYPDLAPFRDLIKEKLMSKKPDGGWDIAYFAELLSYFAADGDPTAEAALWAKYCELLERLRGFRRKGRAMRAARDDLESICLSLSWQEEAYARIAGDLGALFLENDLLDGWGVEWLFDSRPKGVNRRLRQKAASSSELTAYFAALDALKEAKTKRRDTPRDDSPPAGGRPLSVYLKRRRPELIPSYAEAYLAAADPSARAEALTAFSVCPYPSDPTPILIDAESNHSALRNAALEALAEIRDPAVRRFALAHVDEAPAQMLPIAVKNYLPEDEERLYSLVKALPVDDRCRSGWHVVHIEILKLFDRNSKIARPPKSLLPLLYETTLCSCCRETAVCLMSKRRMIPERMWTELLHDSNPDVRSFATRHVHKLHGRLPRLNASGSQ